jgi:hypothetical protein
MPRDDARLKEVAEIRAQFGRHERATRWILTLVAILTALALVFLVGQLVELEAPL